MPAAVLLILLATGVWCGNSFTPASRSNSWARQRSLTITRAALSPRVRVSPQPSPHSPPPPLPSAPEVRHAEVRLLCEDGAMRKSAFDEKSYRVVEFPNGLRACLVSDPSADVCGASVNVHAGSFQDPPRFEGLAHFHEHMLFLGTAKYPGEDDFDDFLARHGGSCNAFTEDEDTNYYFDCAAEPQALAGALDRFASFFRCPTFDLGMVMREAMAVDSEHNNNVPNDGWRLNQVFRKGFDPLHPGSKFATGNLATLAPPGRTPADLHAALVAFHERWYRGPLMTLCVVGKESLAELQALVAPLFGGVRGRDETTPGPVRFGGPEPSASLQGRLARKDNLRHVYPSSRVTREHPPKPSVATTSLSGPWLPSCVGLLRRVAPVSDVREVSVVFPLGGPLDLEAKPHRFWSHTLGHEGPGSLHAVLHAKGWVEELSAGVDTRFDDSAAFHLTLALTEQGEAHLGEVLDAAFLFIKLATAAGPSAAVVAEQDWLEEVDFYFAEGSSAAGLSTLLASRLYDYEPHAILCASALARDLLETFADVASARDCAPSSSTHRAPIVGSSARVSTEANEARMVHALNAISDVARYLVPANALVTIVSPEVVTDYGKHMAALKEDTEPAAYQQGDDSSGRWRVEEWYGVPFHERRMSKAEIERWGFAALAPNLGSLPAATHGGGDRGFVSVVLPSSGEPMTFRPVPPLNRFVPSFSRYSVTRHDGELKNVDDETPGGRNPERLNRAHFPAIELVANDAADLSESELVAEDTTAHAVQGSFLRAQADACWTLAPSTKFERVPRMLVAMNFLSPEAYTTPRRALLAKLFCLTLLSDINTHAYDASIAGLSYTIDSTREGFELKVQGYSSEVPRLVTTILQRATTLAIAAEASSVGQSVETVEAETLADLELRFAAQKELICRDLANSALDSPFAQADKWLRQVCIEDAFHDSEYAALLECKETTGDQPISLRAMGRAAREILGACTIETLVSTGATLKEGEGRDRERTQALRAEEARLVARTSRNDISPLARSALSLTPSPRERELSKKTSSLNNRNNEKPCAPHRRALVLPLGSVHPTATPLVSSGHRVAVDSAVIKKESNSFGGPVVVQVSEDVTNDNSAVHIFLQYGLEAALPTNEGGESDRLGADLADELEPSSTTKSRRGERGEMGRLSRSEEASFDVLCELAHKSIFQRLRTEEQLGYMVSACASRFCGAVGLSLVVQSSRCGPAELERRLGAWASGFAGELEGMADADVGRHARSCALAWERKAKSLADEHGVYSDEILGRRYGWGRRWARADAARAVTKGSLLKAWNERLAPGAPLLRPLRLHCFAQRHCCNAAAGLGTTARTGGGDNGDQGDAVLELESNCEDGREAREAFLESAYSREGLVLRNLADVRCFKQGLQRFAPVSVVWDGGDYQI